MRGLPDSSHCFRLGTDRFHFHLGFDVSRVCRRDWRVRSGKGGTQSTRTCQLCILPTPPPNYFSLCASISFSVKW